MFIIVKTLSSYLIIINGNRDNKSIEKYGIKKVNIVICKLLIIDIYIPWIKTAIKEHITIFLISNFLFT